MTTPTYQLIPAQPVPQLEAWAPPGIQCLTCGLISYNPNDIRERYCGACHRFHDDPLPRGTPDTVGPIGVSDPVGP